MKLRFCAVGGIMSSERNVRATLSAAKGRFLFSPINIAF